MTVSYNCMKLTVRPPTAPHLQWRAQERSANLAAARQRKHEQRLAAFKQRGEWAAEAAAK